MDHPHRRPSPRFPRSTLPALVCAIFAVISPHPAAAQTPADGPPTTADTAQSFRLNLVNAPGGVVVDLIDLVRMLDSIFPGARSRWDAQRGMVSIEVDGHRFDALTGHAVLIVDRRIQSVPRPLQLHQGKIMVPVDSVQVILQGLDLDFELQTGAPTPSTAAATQPTSSTVETGLPEGTPPDPDVESIPDTFPATPDPFAPPPVPGVDPESATPVAPVPGLPLDTAAAASDTLPLDAPSINLAVLITDKPPTPQSTPAPAILTLQPPAGLSPTNGLDWDRLNDEGHRVPPERISLVCDGALEPVARRALEILNRHPVYKARLLVAPSGRRDQEALQRDIDDHAPELLIDLMSIPDDGADPGPALMVWVVNDALWPGDRAHPAAGDPLRAYRPHQLQSLALGSLLRAELYARFQDRLIVYEMAPHYLLRRLGAPAAAVLLPVRREGRETEPALDPQRLAEAVAAAVMDYAEGIRGTL